MTRVRLPNLWSLPWRDLDPARRDLDPAGVPALVRDLPPAGDMPPPGGDEQQISLWYDRMTAALIGHLGDWVVGWPYTVTVENYQNRGRIPVWRWTRPEVTTAPATLDRLSAAVIAWHDLLTELATDSHGRFAAVTRAAHRAGGDGPPAWQAVSRPGRVLADPPPPHPRAPQPWELTWADVDPTGRPFDPGTVAPTVTRLAAAARTRGPGEHLPYSWLRTVTDGLAERYGPWVSGWSWSSGEDSGGPVTAWCCSSHSLTTPERTAATVTAAVLEWHAWLTGTARLFDRFLPLADDDLDGWEHAVACLITAVGDSTRYESRWYDCCLTVLHWFLDAAGVGDTRRDDLITHAVGGRFGSWTVPSRDDVGAVAESLALGVALDRD